MKSPLFNPAVSGLATPAIPQALSWIDAYDESLGPMVDLSQAVPNYPPPDSVLSDLAEFGGSVESTGYGHIEGEPVLRNAYARHVNDVYNSSVSADCVHITSGCNQAFVAALIALAAPGDTVLLSNPSYFNHEATATMLGLKLEYTDCAAHEQFLPNLESLARQLTKRPRILALVTPNNPTGAVYPPEFLDQLKALCLRYGTWLVLDETYRDFLPTGSVIHSIFAQENWQQNFVQLYSFSKSLCIPGHRVGALIAGPAVVENIAKVMDNLQICAPRAAQLTIARQLPLLGEWRETNSQEIADRARCFLSVMAEFPEWKVDSIGAYFAYVQHPYTEPSMDVARRMCQEFGVLPLPGSFFGEGQDKYLRVAFANAGVETLRLIEGRLAAMRSNIAIPA